MADKQDIDDFMTKANALEQELINYKDFDEQLDTLNNYIQTKYKKIKELSESKPLLNWKQNFSTVEPKIQRWQKQRRRKIYNQLSDLIEDGKSIRECLSNLEKSFEDNIKIFINNIAELYLKFNDVWRDLTKEINKKPSSSKDFHKLQQEATQYRNRAESIQYESQKHPQDLLDFHDSFQLYINELNKQLQEIKAEREEYEQKNKEVENIIVFVQNICRDYQSDEKNVGINKWKCLKVEQRKNEDYYNNVIKELKSYRRYYDNISDSSKNMLISILNPKLDNIYKKIEVLKNRTNNIHKEFNDHYNEIINLDKRLNEATNNMLKQRNNISSSKKDTRLQQCIKNIEELKSEAQDTDNLLSCKNYLKDAIDMAKNKDPKSTSVIIHGDSHGPIYGDNYGSIHRDSYDTQVIGNIDQNHIIEFIKKIQEDLAKSRNIPSSARRKINEDLESAKRTIQDTPPDTKRALSRMQSAAELIKNLTTITTSAGELLPLIEKVISWLKP